jgi:drug/metabolite transporter (DMT)-like permease
MIAEHWGEIAALLTAVFWTITALAFETAGKRIGALTLNVVRLYLAFLIYSVFLYFRRGMFLPMDATAESWFWLLLSGLIGFVLGDQFLFQAFIKIGARVSMLIMTLVPPITALIGWLILGEVLSLLNLLGMFLTISGVALVILKRSDQIQQGKKKGKIKLSYPLSGLLLAFGGAAGQAVGLVLSKFGMKDYDPFAASQIRVMAGMFGFTVLFIITGAWHKLKSGLKDKRGMSFVALGSVFGPFLGVSFSLIAIQNTLTGVASTIMAIVPVLIIIPSVLLFKEKVNLREIIGAMIAVSGVALMFID